MENHQLILTAERNNLNEYVIAHSLIRARKTTVSDDDRTQRDPASLIKHIPERASVGYE